MDIDHNEYEATICFPDLYLNKKEVAKRIQF